jgi:hypothetical protein
MVNFDEQSNFIQTTDHFKSETWLKKEKSCAKKKKEEFDNVDLSLRKSSRKVRQSRERENQR